MVPTFYDSIEIKRDHAIAKFQELAARRGAVLAGVSIFLEAICMLLLLRFLYRLVGGIYQRINARRRGLATA